MVNTLFTPGGYLMKMLTVFCLLCLHVGGVFTAAEYPVYEHAATEPTSLGRETFDVLKRRFPGEILDEKLKTLRELAGSTEYLTFLSKRYPSLEIKAFEDVANKVTPPKERYFQFFNEHLYVPTVEEIQDEEQWVIHHLATSSWCNTAYQRGGDTIPGMRKGAIDRPGPLIITKPIGRKVLEHRLFIDSTHEKLTPEDWGTFLFIFRHLNALAHLHLDEDVRWLKTLFEKHGQSEGMLSVAVRDPILLDRLLHAFSTDTTLLKWLYDPVENNRDKR